MTGYAITRVAHLSGLYVDHFIVQSCVVGTSDAAAAVAMVQLQPLNVCQFQSKCCQLLLLQRSYMYGIY